MSGARKDVENDKTFTPLHLAAKGDHGAVADALVSAGEHSLLHYTNHMRAIVKHEHGS